MKLATPLVKLTEFDVPPPDCPLLQLLRVSGTVAPDELVPELIVKVTLLLAPVAILPHESSASTTMGLATLENGVVGELDDTPVGSEVNANCVAEPGPVTPKALLVAGSTTAEPPLGVAVAAIVYG